MFKRNIFTIISLCIVAVLFVTAKNTEKKPEKNEEPQKQEIEIVPA